MFSKPLNLRRLLIPALLLLAVGILATFVFVLVFGLDSLTSAVRDIGLFSMFAATVLSFGSYGWRFIKWDISLRVLGNPVPRWINFRVYLSGLALTASPGKLGETVRGVALIPFGVPLEKTLASFFVDRLCDVAGVGLLGFLASFFVGRTSWLLLALVAAVFLGVLLIKPALRIRWLARTRWAAHFTECLVHIQSLWKVGRVAVFVAVSMVAYGTQGMIFVWFCHCVGFPIEAIDGLWVFSNATLLGAASMIPGGLGAMEASLFWQLVDRGCDQATAFSVTTAFRFVTLWIGMGVGALSLLSLGRLFRQKNAS